MAITRAFGAVCALMCIGLSALAAWGVEYVYPAGARVVDVTQPPYSVDRTGTIECSAKLTQAANDIINASGWGPGIMYLPNGTYLVDSTITWKVTSHGNGIGPHMTGQSRAGTVIKLAKGTWPLGTEAKAVIWTGSGDENNFNKDIQNLTVLVDSNNAGAIGIYYVSDNTGMISDVNVISADGKGMYGIESAWIAGSTVIGGNGPFIIRRTYVRGFANGIRGLASQGGMISQIKIEGQSNYGIWVSGNDMIIDSLVSNNPCIAIQAEYPVFVTNAVLTYTGAPDTIMAIRNFNTGSFFRDIKAPGYGAAIRSVGTVPAPTSTTVSEYSPVAVSTLFSTQTRTINIPARYPPVVAWESDFGKWAFPADYKTGGRTDVQALQAAIDDPTKTTVCLPQGTVLQIDGAVHVRGTIRRIHATGGMVHKVNSNGMFIIDDGSEPAVVIEKMSIDNCDGTAAVSMPIYKRTNRTLVLESLNMSDFHIESGGDAFITDITSGRNYVTNADARVYVWQWEGACCIDSTLTVTAGVVRTVGGYDEGTGTMLYFLGGISEVLGYLEYATSCGYGAANILRVVDNANVSACGVFQQNYCNPKAGYTRLVSETRNGITKVLGDAAGNGDVVSASGSRISLFTAWDSAQVAQVLPSAGVVLRAGSFADARRIGLTACRRPAGVEVSWHNASTGPIEITAFDVAGRTIAVVRDRAMGNGIHRSMLPAWAGVAGIRVRSREGTAGTLLAIPASMER